MSLIDVFVVIALVIAAFLGVRQGFITPALTTLGFATVPLLLLSQPELRRSVEAGPGVLIVIILPIVLAIVGAIIGLRIARAMRRTFALRVVDEGAGVILYGVLLLLATYIAFGLMVAVDVGLAPLHRLTAVGPGDVTKLDASLRANPVAPALLDPRDLGPLADAAKERPIPIDEIGRYDQRLGLYELVIRPQLVTSRVAPLIVAAGSQIQLGGQVLPMPTYTPRDQEPHN